MECAVCGCPLDGAEMPSYLYSCEDLVCCLHVLGPYCYRHSDALLIGEMSTDSDLKRLKEIKDWLERQNSGGSLDSAVAGIKKDMGKYLALVVAGQGGGVSGMDPEDCSTTPEYTYWVCLQCSSQNTQESANCWRCQTNRNGQLPQGGIWACPWCNSGHYAEEVSCQCGYPPQPIETKPDQEEKELKTAVLTSNVEVQVQFPANSIGTMTESHCDKCKVDTPCRFLCEECGLPTCGHCSKAMGQTEWMCEGCRDRFQPICCEKCGEKAVKTYCGDCFVGRKAEIGTKETSTDALICVKCGKSPANEVICTQCTEPEPLICSNCHEIASKDLITCEKCQKSACTRCQSPLSSSQLLCSKCTSPAKVFKVDLFSPPNKPERPVKALDIKAFPEESKFPAQILAADKGTPQKASAKAPVIGLRVLKQGESYQSKASRPLSAMPAASGQRPKLHLTDPPKPLPPSRPYAAQPSSSSQPVPVRSYTAQVNGRFAQASHVGPSKAGPQLILKKPGSKKVG